jgi:hypothetical protein
VVLSSAQNKYLKDLMDLADHAVVSLDTNSYLDGAYPYLFILQTSNGLYASFVVDPSTNTFYILIDYNGDSLGRTYYRLDSAIFDKVLEANFYLFGLLYPDKADATPTFDAFYIGDQLNYEKASDLPMKSLTSAQITTIDGLLQRQSWQEFGYFYETGLRLKSKFVLRKDSNSFYIFSQYGSQSVVTDQTVDGGSQNYIIPNSALNDVLNALKLIK